jgi:hypothetical protein
MTTKLTPREAADCANKGAHNQRLQEFIVLSPPRELEEFCHYLDAGAHSKYFHLARIALDLWLAEAADKTAQKLVAGTDTLITETKTLVKLTKGLIGLTVVLAIIASFEIFKFLFGLLCRHVQ